MTIDISVIIPTYRRSKYLDDAIKSALNQSYSSLEVIIVDDNAELSEYRTETKKLEQNYKKKYDNIKFFYPKKNLGAGLARNYGVDNAKGKYVTFLDDDDYFLENNKLSLCVDYLEKYNADISYNFAIDSNGQIYQEYYNENFMFYLFKYGSVFSTAQLTVRKEKFVECGGYKDIITKEDAVLTYDLLKYNPKVICVPYVLYYYRYHNNPRRSNSKKSFYGELYLYDKYKIEKNNFSEQEQYDIEIKIYERLIKHAIESKEIKYLIKFITLLILKYKIKGLFVLLNNSYKLFKKIFKNNTFLKYRK